MPQVSVIIPVYNIESCLRACLDSILNQTLTDFEVICVNDGSTDGSPAILSEYAEKDSRMQVLTQKNGGPGVARNAGLDMARGDYVIFLDSDDWFDSGLLQRMAGAAAEARADVAICRGVEFDTETGRELPSEWMLKSQYLPGPVFSPQEVAGRLFQFTYGMPWDKLYRRAFLLDSGVRYPPLRNSEDLAFVYPTLLCARRIVVVEDVLIHHRINRSASVSNSRCSQPEAPYQAFRIVKEFLEERGLMDRYQRSFLNWAMEFLVWHVSNMPQREIQKQYLSVLRKTWVPELRFEDHPSSYYQDKGTYAKYLLARYAPYPVFSAVVRLYKMGKRVLR